MTRQARAILVGASETGSSPSVPSAIGVVDEIATHLTQQFGANVSLVKLVGSKATRAAVLQAFEDERQQAGAGDLFVVLFAGHGIPATVDRRYQAWALHSQDQFTDLDLARELLAFDVKLDTVVISACCYGQGMFIGGPFIHISQPPASTPLTSRPLFPAGPTPIELDAQFQLRVWNQQRVAILESALRTKNAPMVCISAAAKDGQAFAAVLDEFAEKIVWGAVKGKTYQALAECFDADAVVNRAFQVNARPPNRMTDFVLDPK
jgi:hypothetical protein